MVSKFKKILVVEDEKSLSDAMQLKLGSLGHKIVVAKDGQKAVELLNKDDFDVMLLDLMIPTMNGFQVLDKTQSMPKKPAIFVLTNLAQPDDEKRVFELGADRFYVKADTPLESIIEEVNKF